MPVASLEPNVTLTHGESPPPGGSQALGDPLKSLELFAGAGGLALGVHQAGFEHLGLIEWDKSAVATLRRNGPSVFGVPEERVIHADARSVDYNQYTGRIDLLSGGPPCQPFSSAGRNRGHADARNMFPVFLDAVATVRPRAILMENVKGLGRAQFSTYLEYLRLRLRFPFAKLDAEVSWEAQLEALRRVQPGDFTDDERYHLDVGLVDTADFGVPQRRERVVFMAYRADLGLVPEPPKPTHSKVALLVDQWITSAYWERHGIAPYDNLTTSDRKLKDTLSKTEPLLLGKSPWRTVRDCISDLPPAVPRGEHPVMSNHVQHPGARIYPPQHLGSSPDYPAKALKAGTHGTPGGENILRSDHENILRYFTTREAGRLQTFPDEWEFLGTWGACIKQLGNAVPVELGRVYAEVVRRQLRPVAAPSHTR